MLNWALTFFIIAIVAAVLGFTSIAGSAIEIAQVLFYGFLILSVLLYLFSDKHWPDKSYARIRKFKGDLK